MKLKIYGELAPYLVILIMIGGGYYSQINWTNYLIWKEFLDHIVLLIFLVFMYFHSHDWNFYSQRILYSFMIIHTINTYTILFGMPFDVYFEWYFMPLIVMINVTVFSIVIKIGFNLYKLLKNGENKVS